MKNIQNTISNFWNNHVHAIAGVAIAFSIWTIILAIMLAGTCVDLLGTMHDMEVQLAAHGVEWALYTPVP